MSASSANPLSGVRIWLSASVPDEAPPEVAERIRLFVKCLATEVFALGGTIVHGWHPSLLNPLREAAQRYKDATGDRAPLAMFVSKWFSEEPQKYNVDIPAWNNLCAEQVEETPKAVAHDSNDEKRRSMSLSIMRQELATRCHAIVAIGGKWWTIARAKAGVAQEINLALASNLPLFLLGGMGGTVEGLLKANSNLLEGCANGFSVTQNEALAAQSNPERAVGQVIEQLQRLPLRAIAAKNEKPFRVLCLDGGGIRGVYTASVLAYWEKALNLHQPGRPRLVDHFDLIVGTSTGGIIAVGLALGMSAADMKKFYEERGANIFGSGEGLDKWWHSFRHWFTSKFDQSRLREQLQQAYSSSPVARKGLPQTEWLDETPCKLLIPAYNVQTDKPYLFRSPYGRFLHTDRGHDPVMVALSTAAAPTYFDPVKSRGAVVEIESVDGGVWANSPVSLAIAEAVAELKIPIGRIRLLSIGTTYTSQLTGQPMQLDGKTISSFISKVFPSAAGAVAAALTGIVWKPVDVKGKLGWVSNIAGLLMKAQTQTSNLVGQQLLGERYVRIDSDSQHGDLDDVKNIDHFAGLGENSAEQAESFARVQALFLS